MFGRLLVSFGAVLVLLLFNFLGGFWDMFGSFVLDLEMALDSCVDTCWRNKIVF